LETQKEGRKNCWGDINQGGGFCLILHERINVPTVFYRNGFRFYFWSREENRAHIHIEKGDGEAKYWLEPKIECHSSKALTPAENKFVEKTVKEEYKTLLYEFKKKNSK
jgi:hypothetical protein